MCGALQKHLIYSEEKQLHVYQIKCTCCDVSNNCAMTDTHFKHYVGKTKCLFDIKVIPLTSQP